MNNIPKSFLSPLCSIITTNYCDNIMTRNSNISEIPTFCQAKEKDQYSDIDLLLSDAIGEKPSYKKRGYLEFLATRGLASSL